MLYIMIKRDRKNDIQHSNCLQPIKSIPSIDILKSHIFIKMQNLAQGQRLGLYVTNAIFEAELMARANYFRISFRFLKSCKMLQWLNKNCIRNCWQVFLYQNLGSRKATILLAHFYISSISHRERLGDFLSFNYLICFIYLFVFDTRFLQNKTNILVKYNRIPNLFT